jgi:hypothetical protein
MLAEYRAQRRLRQLARRFEDVGDANDRFLGIDDAEIDDRVDSHRDVVPRNDVLRRHVEHDDAQVDLDHLLQTGNQDDESGPLDLLEAAQEEHDAALVFLEDLERVVGDDDHHRGDQSDCCKFHR